MITVLGSQGFIGSSLITYLRAAGADVVGIDRAHLPAFLTAGRPAGTVISTIGLTADWRSSPLKTAEAHVGVVARILADVQFDSFLLLSSTRVYKRAQTTQEDLPVPTLPTDPDDLYDITKLAGEALCLNDPRPSVRVIRLSNVVGPGMGGVNFLGQLITEGMSRGAVLLRQSLLSSKDYIDLDDVVRLLPLIAQSGQHRLYNLASGTNTTHGELAAAMTQLFGWSFSVAQNAATLCFPVIDISRLEAEFGRPRSGVLLHLPAIAAGLMQGVQPMA